MDKVKYSKRVKKQINDLPVFVFNKFFKWVDLIENDGWEIAKDILSYKYPNLKGKWKDYKVACFGESYRAIYKVYRDGKRYIIEIEKVSKHDYKRR